MATASGKVVAAQTADGRPVTDADKAIDAEVKGAYGSPRMVRELRHRDLSASKGQVERLM